MPRVAAVLVVHDGAEWLASVLGTLAAQQYPALDLIVVDSGSTDGSSEILARHIPDDRLLVLPRNVGFTRAVAAAISHPLVAEADLLLFLHDDLVLAPDAIARLVVALRDDPTLAAVGPKLREWSDDGVLAEIGMTIDRFGRAEPRVDRGELDQGQHDRDDEVLYVSTAGMLIRRDVFRQLGGFDTRFPAYRDDLDLCWRAWLYGFRVEVAPRAVGYHIGAGARAGRRFGGGAHGGRYLAERHSVAAMLKNYSPSTLLWVLPVTVLLAVAKTLAFVLIRRFGEASAVFRAYLWNVAQLPLTLRRRRAVQHRRVMSDRSISRLFAPGLPRARLYAGALGGWLSGGSTRALIDDDTVAADFDRHSGRTLTRLVRERPAVVFGLVLAVAYLVGLAPFLGSGQVVGGDIAPWPDAARDFLRAYASPHSGGPLGTAGFASPIQAVLGLFSYLGMGSAWLAQRLLVFGLVPVAWLLALRAGRLITGEAGPRVLGATLYALSPIVLGTLGQGRYGVLVVAALLPGLVLVGVRAVDTRVAAATNWRATALLALGLAVATAADPSLGPMLVAGVIVGAVVTALRRPPGAGQAIARLGVAVVAAAALLSPWLVGVVAGGQLFDPAGGSGGPLRLWRAVTGVPQVLPGVGGIAGLLTALTSVAVVAASILLGLRRRPDVVAVLSAAGAGTAIIAWVVGRAQIDWIWPPALLLPTALAIAGLAVLAARSAAGALAQYAFGVRQLSVVVATAMLGVGLFTAIIRLGAGPYANLQLQPELVPAFVSADAPRVGPYRVLLLEDRAGQVQWDVVAPGGPSMVGFGATTSRELSQALDAAVAGLAGGDPRAGAGLGALNVRYIVAASEGPREALARALADQPALEPLPSGSPQVYRARSWLPRAVVAPPRVAAVLATTDAPQDTTALEEQGLRPRRGGTYRGEAQRSGVLLLAEAADAWVARADGRALEQQTTTVPLGEGVGLPSWTVTETDNLLVAPAGATRHRVVLVAQVLLLLAVISLALRPPGFTRHRQERQRARGLPRQLTQQAEPTARTPGDSSDSDAQLPVEPRP